VEDLALLEALYETAPVLPSRYLGAWTEQDAERAWRRWCSAVVEAEVELKPAGLAIVRHPASDYRVDLQWAPDRKGTFRLFTVAVIPDNYLSHFPRSYDMHVCTCAFHLRVKQAKDRSAFRQAPRRRPVAGNPIDPDFYRRLLDSYERLVVEGYRNPAVELARRMNEKHGTVKSWLSRGRKYLGEPPKRTGE